MRTYVKGFAPSTLMLSRAVPSLVGPRRVGDLWHDLPRLLQPPASPDRAVARRGVTLQASKDKRCLGSRRDTDLLEPRCDQVDAVALELGQVGALELVLGQPEL
jgi:hypothetical protein